jgi:hypothetical protein
MRRRNHQQIRVCKIKPGVLLRESGLKMNFCSTRMKGNSSQTKLSHTPFQLLHDDFYRHFHQFSLHKQTIMEQNLVDRRKQNGE